MNVASLELCKELYELSGWHEVESYWSISSGEPHQYISNNWYDENIVTHGFYPAYDLGYLLRKLPAEIEYEGYESRFTLTHKRCGYMNRHRHWMLDVQAETPEDALTKLCIKMFRTGILTRDSIREGQE